MRNNKCIKCSLWRSEAVNAALACCQPPQHSAESIPWKRLNYCSNFVYALSREIIGGVSENASMASTLNAYESLLMQF